MKIGYLMQAGVPDLRQRPLSGPAIHVIRVIQELRQLGHEVDLLAQLDGRIWKSHDLGHFERVQVRQLDQGLARLFERGVRRIQSQFRLPYAAWFESDRFAQACRQELRDCDVLYERLGWIGYGGALAARAMHVPLILEVNGDHLAELEMEGMAPRGAQRWLSVALMRRLAHAASHTVAAGEGWRARYIERWGVDARTISVVENGSELVNLLAREQLRCFTHETNDALTIAYSGGFDAWQGVTILIRAVARALATGSNVRLLLMGAGAQMSEAQQLVRDLGIEARVTFAGRLGGREYAERLATADVGASPYCGRDEFSGLKLLDYKAAGLATIASGKNGQPAIITHERTGLIVPPCDQDALSRAIVRLASDYALVKQLGQAARVEAEQTHSWRHTAQELEKIFAQTIQDDHGRR